MEVTAVRITKSKGDTAKKAVATVTLDDMIAIHGISVIKPESGNMFISMPNKPRRDSDERMDIVHPINAEARKILTDAILAAYNGLSRCDV